MYTASSAVFKKYFLQKILLSIFWTLESFRNKDIKATVITEKLGLVCTTIEAEFGDSSGEYSIHHLPDFFGVVSVQRIQFVTSKLTMSEIL